MAVDGVLKFNTKVNTDGVDRGTDKISSRVLGLKNKIANTEAEARRLRRELEDLARTPIDTTKSTALKNKITETTTAIREAGHEYDALVEKIRQRSTDSKGVLDTKSFNVRMSTDPELKEKDRQIQQLNADLAKYRTQLESAQAAEMKTTGADTAEYARKQERLNELNGRLSVYKAQLSETQARESSAASASRSFSGGLSKATSIAKKLSSGLRTCASHLGKVARAGFNAAKNGLSRVASALKNITSHSKSANNSLNLLKTGFKKLQRWGLTLIGIRSLVTGIRQTVTSALQNNEELQNSLTATKGVIGQMLTPVITVLLKGLQMIVSLADRIYQIFTGTSAIAKYNAAQAAKMAKSQEKAAKNAKKQKDYLASFDQLNVMTKNDTSNSNSNSDASESAAYFEKLTTPFDNFFDKLSNLFKKGKFYEIGKLIAESINNSLKKINWTKIRKTAKSIAKKIADLINGFIDKIDWNLLGTTLGNGIMTVVDFAYTFLNRVKWKKLGQGIAKFLNGVIKTINWSKVGKTLGSGVNAIINTAYGFVTTFDWKQFGTGIHDAIKGAIEKINWQKARVALTTGINGFVSMALSIIGSPDFEQLGENIAQGIKDTLNGINWANISQLFTTLVVGAFKIIDGFNLAIDWNTLGRSIADSFNAFYSKDGAGHQIVNTMANSVASLICSLLTTLDEITLSIDWETFGRTIADDFNSFFGETGKGRKVLETTSKTIGDLCNSGMKSVIEFFEDDKTADTLVETLESFVKSIPWKTILINALTVILDAASWLIDAAGQLVEDFCEGLATGFEDSSTDPELKKALTKLGKAVGNLFITLLEAACRIIVNAIPNFVLGLLKCILGLIEEALRFILGDELKQALFGEWNLWGKDSWKINYDINLPRLASGTVVPANYGEYLAVLGDNKREPEVVSPLSTMKQAFLEAMSEIGGFDNEQQKTYIFELDGDVLFKHVVNANEKDKKRYGKSRLA